MQLIGPSGRWPCRQRALTLVECVLALTILPLAVTAIALAVTAGQAQALEALERTRAALLAEALMEEILALPYNDPDGASNPGPEPGESNRTLFDNLDDFHGYSEAPGNLTDATTTAYPSPFQGFARSVTCSTASVNVPDLGTTIDGLQITVTVSSSGAPVVTLTRFVAQPTTG